MDYVEILWYHQQVLREREREKAEKLREYQHQRVRERLHKQLPPIIIVEQSPSQQQQQDSNHQVKLEHHDIFLYLRSNMTFGNLSTTNYLVFLYQNEKMIAKSSLIQLSFWHFFRVL